MMTGQAPVPVDPPPPAAVMVFRPSASGPEVLFLRRNPKLAFHGGYWVFPGGRIDPGDYGTVGVANEATAARQQRCGKLAKRPGSTYR